MANGSCGKGIRRCCQCGFTLLTVAILSIVALVVKELSRHPIVQRAANCRLGLGEHGLRPDEHAESKLRHVHIVYASDRGGLPGLLMSMASLARHVSAPENTTIHVIVKKELMADAEELVGCFREEVGSKAPLVHLLELRQLPFNVANKTELVTSAVPETWVRLLLHEDLPGVPRVLWLDTDVLVQADIAPLYRMHMDHPIAAARDWGVKESPGVSGGINAGIVVIDLERFPPKVTPHFDGIQQNVWNNDQAFLCDVFPEGSYDKLDWRWNTNTMAAYFADEDDYLQMQSDVERVFFRVITWLSGTVWENCQKEVRLLHLNFGPFPKYWKRPTLNDRNCEMLLPFKLHKSCLGWQLPCLGTCGANRSDGHSKWSAKSGETPFVAASACH